MSGGHFEYNQYVLEDIKDRINQTQEEVNNKPSLSDMLSDDFSMYNYVEDKEGFNLVCNTAKFYLDMAQTLVQRLDWYISGDDSEESFKQRMLEDIDKVLEQHKEIIVSSIVKVNK